MGKRLIVQRRGKGSAVFRVNGHKREQPVKYRKISRDEFESSFYAEILELFHEPARGAPLARVKFFDGYQTVILPAEGVAIGDRIHYGATSDIREGNVLPLEFMPLRTTVFNVELRKGDGGKFVRAGGGSALIDSKTEKWVVLKLPSGKLKKIPKECRATVGVCAGGGRTSKPHLKAGNKYHAMHAKGHKYPRVRGVAQGAYQHPHGGGHHQSPSQPTTVSRNAPPGAKVGLIAARRTGYKRGRQKRDESMDQID